MSNAYVATNAIRLMASISPELTPKQASRLIRKRWRQVFKGVKPRPRPTAESIDHRPPYVPPPTPEFEECFECGTLLPVDYPRCNVCAGRRSSEVRWDNRSKSA